MITLLSYKLLSVEIKQCLDNFPYPIVEYHPRKACNNLKSNLINISSLHLPPDKKKI